MNPTFLNNLNHNFAVFQVGPIFFKTPQKCEVFGVCCEGTGTVYVMSSVKSCLIEEQIVSS